MSMIFIEKTAILDKQHSHIVVVLLQRKEIG